MAVTLCQVMGFVLGLLGLAGIIAATGMDPWSTQDLYNNPVTAIYTYSGLWRSCVRQTTGFTECRPYFTILGLPGNVGPTKPSNILMSHEKFQELDKGCQRNNGRGRM